MDQEPTNLRERLAENDEDMLFMVETQYDEAIVGAAMLRGGGHVAVYDVDKIIEILQAEGMEETDAWEYFDFNILGSYVGEHTPIFMRHTKAIVESL